MSGLYSLGQDILKHIFKSHLKRLILVFYLQILEENNGETEDICDNLFFSWKIFVLGLTLLTYTIILKTMMDGTLRMFQNKHTLKHQKLQLGQHEVNQ